MFTKINLTQRNHDVDALSDGLSKLTLITKDEKLHLWHQDSTVSKILSCMAATYWDKNVLMRLHTSGTCRTIERLSLCGADFSAKQIDDLTFYFPKIAELRVKASLLGADWSTKVRKFKNLKVLNLTDCRGVDDRSIADIGELRGVHTVILKSTQISDKALEVVATWTNVTSLDVRNTYTTDRGLALVCDMPKLKNLRLARLSTRSPCQLGGEAIAGITASGFENLVQKAKKLKYIDIFGCVGIPQESIQGALSKGIQIVTQRCGMEIAHYHFGEPIGKPAPSGYFACYKGFDFAKEQVLLSQIISERIAYKNLPLFCEEFQEELQVSGPFIRFLDLTNARYHSNSVIEQAELTLLAQFFPNVQKITIAQKGQNPDAFCKPIRITIDAVCAIPLFEKLTVLDFAGYFHHEEVEDARFAKALKNCEKLQYLNMSLTEISSDVFKELCDLKNLKYLDISRCDGIDTDSFLSFIAASACSQLEWINITSCSQIQWDEGMRLLAQNTFIQTVESLLHKSDRIAAILQEAHFKLESLSYALLVRLKEAAPTIRRLDFSECVVGRQDLEMLAKRFINLECLCFENAQFLPTSFRALRHFAKLEDLDLRGSTGIDGEAGELISACESIERLGLEGTDIDDTGLHQALECPKLRIIDISSCQNIKNKSVARESLQVMRLDS